MLCFNLRFGPVLIMSAALLLGACGDGEDSPGADTVPASADDSGDSSGAADADAGGNAGPGGDTDPDGDSTPGGDTASDGSETGADTGAHSPAPIVVPGTFEAEDFDPGGEYVGYHDTTPGNQGGEYRPDEDVDIVVSGDPEGGGHDVADFEAGEWLAYTIEATATTDYDIAMRVASTVADSALRIEIDDVDVTGSLNVPGTGSADGYQWINAARVGLTAGPHLVRVHADGSGASLNAVRVTAVPTPYSGVAVLIPATLEAEHFDSGGPGAGYGDNTPGNQGDAQFRTGEDVDIFPSDDAAGGAYIVRSFEPGEWLGYQIEVASDGEYDVELRAATHADFPDSAFHVEIDGADVTGTVVLPDTGGWNSYRWVARRSVWLEAGVHQLGIVAERPYFNLNSIRVTHAADATGQDQTGLLFNSGFEGPIALGIPVLFGNGAWQDITGLDSETGQLWPPVVWGGTGGRLQLIAGDSLTGSLLDELTLGSYTYNALETVTGRDGGSTRALYSHVQQSIGGASQNWDATQSNFQIHPGPNGQGDLYLSYWLRFQPDLLERMTVNNWAGRAVSDWKTGIGTGGGGDYRVLLSVFGDGANDRLYWNLKGDNVANGGLPQQVFWEQSNHSAPVPVGRWFRVEVFVHRGGGSDGRVWVAVDGQEIFDRYGPNMGVDNLPWNRIMPFINYSTGQLLPAYQWVDDLELWADFPSTASPH